MFSVQNLNILELISWKEVQVRTVFGSMFSCISMSLSISITNRFSIDICVLISEILLVEEGSKMSHDREGQLNSQRPAMPTPKTKN